MSDVAPPQLRAGDVRIVGGKRAVSADEIIDFGKRFDPQPMHTDPRIAESRAFGGLIASGWQTIATLYRDLISEFACNAVWIECRGAEHIRFRLPVRPGDVLRTRFEALEVATSAKRAEATTWRLDCQVFNQKDERVLTMEMLVDIGGRAGS